MAPPSSWGRVIPSTWARRSASAGPRRTPGSTRGCSASCTLVRERIDLTALAREILDDLAEHEHGRVVESSVADGLFAHADRRLVAVLLENLLGNAWKFTSKTPLARIQVGREEHESETVFFVRDNGAGFAMEFASKLFAPFQRLHAQEDFAGTGIGLATVRRVVDRHVGRVWAEAAPGRGATFFFTLTASGSS